MLLHIFYTIYQRTVEKSILIIHYHRTLQEWHKTNSISIVSCIYITFPFHFRKSDIYRLIKEIVGYLITFCQLHSAVSKQLYVKVTLHTPVRTVNKRQPSWPVFRVSSQSLKTNTGLMASNTNGIYSFTGAYSPGRTFGLPSGFLITHIETHGRTPLDEWSARRRGLYLHRTTQHINKRDKHPWPERDWNPRPQQPSGRRPTP
jgi:hypothetical protein